MVDQEKSIAFYSANYDIIGAWFLRPGEKVVLGDKSNRICRFCAKGAPEVTFKKIAHAIPELLGNKSIESSYECDICNEEFGKGIENDLGNWSKPMRTLIRIRGKNGVPTLKKGGDQPGWRIEYDDSKLSVRAYENDPIYEVDEKNRSVTFKLRRDAYTPIAVLKAFIKIGLTLLPDAEIGNFLGLITWIKEKNHRKPYLNQCPVIYTFLPGPMPNDFIAACILRRKQKVTGIPYAFLVLSYGNETFQIPLPSEQLDGVMNKQSSSIYPFPIPRHQSLGFYGDPKVAVLNWMQQEVRRGDVATIKMHFDSKTLVDPSHINQNSQLLRK